MPCDYVLPSIIVYLPKREKEHLIRKLVESGDFYVIFWFVFDHDWRFNIEDWEPVAIKYHQGQISKILIRPHCRWKIINATELPSTKEIFILFIGPGHAPVVKTKNNQRDFDNQIDDDYDFLTNLEFSTVKSDEIPENAVTARRPCIRRMDIRLKLNQMYQDQHSDKDI